MFCSPEVDGLLPSMAVPDPTDDDSTAKRRKRSACGSLHKIAVPLPLSARVGDNALMKALILNEAEVHALLTMRECIEVMEEALSDLARGDAFNPLRNILRPVGAKGFFGLMPAYRGGDSPAFGLKEVCVFPGNPGIGLDTHVGAVLLHSAHTGELQAVMNASAITAVRTAAVTALATRVLSRRDASTLAIIGTGAQARSHLQSIPLVRELREVRLAGRTMAHAEEFVGKVKELRISTPPLRVCQTVQEALQDVDIIVTTTSSSDPLFSSDWIRAGAHLNLVGSSIATAREADSATMAAGSLFVDRRESAMNESGDYLFAVRDGLIGPDHIRAELGEVLIGRHPGRTSESELTIFKSLGLSIEDLAAAQFLYRKAQDVGTGTWVDL